MDRGRSPENVPLAPLHTNISSHSTSAKHRRRLSTSSRSFRGRKRSSLFSASTLVPQDHKSDSLFKDPQPVTSIWPIPNDLSWYHPWLHSQVGNISPTIHQLRVGEDTLLQGNGFERIFAAVASFVRGNDGVSIDEIVEHLQINHGMENTREAFKAQRQLVFAILGWQSMLYRAEFNICSQEEFAIYEEEGQMHSGLVLDKARISADLADRPLFVLLKDFGNLLPSPSSNIGQAASENSKTASTWLPLDPSEINIHFLATLLHVQVRWVDSLALHLDYNKSKKILSLFCCPSFCAAMIQNKGSIFSFASTEKKSFNPRANEDDIAQLMEEILLSYRLLFGQHSASRKLFLRLYTPPEPMTVADPLLLKLCMTSTRNIRQFVGSAWMPSDQPVYFAGKEFQVLRERLEVIVNELKASRPSSLRDLLHDRRDTLQYWTFWLVSIIGGISILLSFMQVILQGIQLSRA